MSGQKLQLARSVLKRVGEKTRNWERIRRQLKAQFFQMNITRCEICNSDFALSFSHAVKRRYITTEAELMNVVLLCAVHHQFIENHPQKIEIHNQIIEQRG